jgi:hypothetical protein
MLAAASSHPLLSCPRAPLPHPPLLRRMLHIRVHLYLYLLCMQVALIHLYQAALFASPHRSHLHAAPSGAPAATAAAPAAAAAHVPPLRSTSDEVGAAGRQRGRPGPA